MSDYERLNEILSEISNIEYSVDSILDCIKICEELAVIRDKYDFFSEEQLFFKHESGKMDKALSYSSKRPDLAEIEFKESVGYLLVHVRFMIHRV